MRRELAGGCHGLLVLGTLGEGETVPFAERAQVIATAVRVASGCVPVVVGIHTCDIQKALVQMRQARELGATHVLVKYLNNPRASSAAVLEFFTALSDSHILPILYYHFPDATGLFGQDAAHPLPQRGDELRQLREQVAQAYLVLREIAVELVDLSRHVDDEQHEGADEHEEQQEDRQDAGNAGPFEDRDERPHGEGQEEREAHRDEEEPAVIEQGDRGDERDDDLPYGPRARDDVRRGSEF